MSIIREILVSGGDKALLWLTATLMGMLVLWVRQRMGTTKAAGIVNRALQEVQDTVLHIEQAYTGALRDANADGKLTPEEIAKADKMALDVLKSNIGTSGLKKLGGILGLDASGVTSWLGSKLKAAVSSAKTNGVIAASSDGAENPK